MGQAGRSAADGGPEGGGNCEEVRKNAGADPHPLPDPAGPRGDSEVGHEVAHRVQLRRVRFRIDQGRRGADQFVRLQWTTCSDHQRCRASASSL
uniref:Uncharacterized protein n=1 Tax=Anopheles atroparvus TaxID=41427 RepID=A0AAG5DK94_ANOAO